MPDDQITDVSDQLIVLRRLPHRVASDCRGEWRVDVEPEAGGLLGCREVDRHVAGRQRHDGQRDLSRHCRSSPRIGSGHLLGSSLNAAATVSGLCPS